ncbi:hypothetical protein SynMVIR181_01993 [Synechococcus sp. MVIR-18-1]|nr:hypothetical protein SynMVIR181_01993 [Synechococcus sp. MVIR-18-1]
MLVQLDARASVNPSLSVLINGRSITWSLIPLMERFLSKLLEAT